MTKKVKETEGEFLTPDEVAHLLKRTRSFVFKAWKKWMKQGVRPIRINKTKNGRLLFRKSEIAGLLEKWSLRDKK